MEITFYGLVYAIGFITSYLTIKYYFKKIKKQELTYRATTYLILGTLIGARLLYVLYYDPSMLLNPLRILLIQKGGLSFHGGLLGAFIASHLFCKSNNINLKEFGDVLAKPLIFFLALGKIANYINQESYGKITEIDWCVQLSTINGCRHPVQLYESIAYFSLFIILIFYSKKGELKPGQEFLTMISAYSIIRFFIDFFREYQWSFLDLGAGQYLNLITFTISTVFLYKYSKKYK